MLLPRSQTFSFSVFTGISPHKRRLSPMHDFLLHVDSSSESVQIESRPERKWKFSKECGFHNTLLEARNIFVGEIHIFWLHFHCFSTSIIKKQFLYTSFFTTTLDSTLVLCRGVKTKPVLVARSYISTGDIHATNTASEWPAELCLEYRDRLQMNYFYTFFQVLYDISENIIWVAVQFYQKRFQTVCNFTRKQQVSMQCIQG